MRYFEPATRQRQPTTITAPNSNASSLQLLHGIPAQISYADVPPFCRSNTRDYELYCHFQTRTAPSFSYQEIVQKLFREEFPKIATSFPFVGHGILSVAYIHLAGQSQASSRNLLAEAAFHVNQALPEYSEALRDITEQNSAALFGFAMFVVLFDFANVNEECGVLLRAARRETEPESDKKGEIVKELAGYAARVAHGMHNIFGIFWRCQRWISSSALAPVIQRYSPPMLSEPSMSWIRVEDGHLAALNNLWQGNPAIPLHHSCALSDALNSLRDTFAMVTQLTVLRPHGHRAVGSSCVDLSQIHTELSDGRLDDIPSVFTWYIRLSPDFISMVEAGNGYAMVVLAHYAIVLHRATCDKWWIHNLPERFVASAELVLGQERRAWIEWPLLVVDARNAG